MAVEAWTTYPDLLRTLPGVLPTEGSRNAYYSRLQSIASNPQARQYAREELSFFFKIADFKNAQTVRRWSAYSAADPELAARNIAEALNSSTVEERSQIEGDARRQIVWTLIRLAWRPQSFHDATMALALLSEAENESWGNNATGEFIGRFQIHLGGTALPYVERMSLIDELLAKKRPGLTRLVIRALGRAAEHHVTRNSTEPASDELPATEWQPATLSEYVESVGAAIDRLVTLAAHASSNQEGDLVAAAIEFAMMLREAPVRPLVIRLFDAVRAAYPNTREELRRAIDEVVSRERKFWKELSSEELTELDSLHARFEDPSLSSRLRQFVGPSHWETGEKPDLRPLARELILSPIALSQEWLWLTSGEAEDGWRLGEALAEEDPERTLAATAASLPGSGHDLRLLCAYISVWKGKLGENWYDDWLITQTERQHDPAPLLFEFAWRCGVTATVARMIVNMLQSRSVDATLVGRLEFGRWGRDLQPDILDEVLRAMINNGHNKTALVVLDQRIRDLPAEVDRWRELSLILICSSELIRSDHMTSWHWKELALRYVDESAAEIAAVIIDVHCDRSNHMWSARYADAATVLKACADRDPLGIWKALLPMLSSEDAYIHSIGFPAGIIDRIFERVPQDVALAWIDENPDVHAVTIARFIHIDLSSDSTIAARVLAAHGDKPNVAQAFFSNYVSGSWWGPASSHWETKAKALEDASKTIKSPLVRKWAMESARSLIKMVEQDRQREEERDLRGYH